MTNMTKEEEVKFIAEEMEKCIQDPFYFYENYWTVNDEKSIISEEQFHYYWNKRMFKEGGVDIDGPSKIGSIKPTL